MFAGNWKEKKSLFKFSMATLTHLFPILHFYKKPSIEKTVRFLCFQEILTLRKNGLNFLYMLHCRMKRVWIWLSWSSGWPNEIFESFKALTCRNICPEICNKITVPKTSTNSQEKKSDWFPFIQVTGEGLHLP